jgi:hypothetical protein
MVTRRRYCQSLILAALAMAIHFVAWNHASAAVSTLISNGAPTNRVDIVFLGDGYTQANLAAGVYTSHVQNYVDHMFDAPNFLADPFPRYHKFFNVHKIDVVSNQSGADDPSPGGIFRDTALDATYDHFGFPELLVINEGKASNTLVTGLAGTGIIADMRIVAVNDDQYGGSGGLYAVFAGGNQQSRDLALHESSHAFSSTADEYGTVPGTYIGGEPSAVNVTKDPAGAKWSHWLGFSDPRADYLEVGVFEGALNYAQGVYRPTLDSKMRTLGKSFNAVVREKTILDIYAVVDPLDDWLENVGTITDSQLWVDVIDPEVISVDWYVNGQRVAADHGEAFDLAEFRNNAGTYSIRAHAYDVAVRHSGDGSLHDLVRKNLAALQQEIVWTVNFPGIPLAGDYDADGSVDDADYLVWKASFGSNVKLAADGNDNGRVDAADFAVWRNNFGALSSGAGATQLPTPEPVAWHLVIVAAPLGLLIRRRMT